MKYQKNTIKLWKNKFPWKNKTSHKYSRGRVLIFGSQTHMVGATILAAEACLRVGVGSVKIVCDKKNLNIYSKRFPSVLKVIGNTFKEIKKIIWQESINCEVALIGPGAGNNTLTRNTVLEVLKKFKFVILDADALSSFEKSKEKLIKNLHNNTLITPHRGEFFRIFKNQKKIENDLAAIKQASKICKSNILLKGHITLIADHKGSIIANKNSTPELAVIGSGDVLAGIISSLIGSKKMSIKEAAAAGVWIHSYAAKKFGTGLIAEDIIKNIPLALKYLKNA